MPAPGPGAAPEPAHDVLAAEEFGMPAGDPALHHGPVTLPGDPTGIAEPHDVLAAEEFAMPAPRRHETLEAQRRARPPRRCWPPRRSRCLQRSCCANVALKSQTRLVPSQRPVPPSPLCKISAGYGAPDDARLGEVG